MGRWKNNILLACELVRGATELEGTAIPFSPSSYAIFDHNQFVPAREFEQDVEKTKTILERELPQSVENLRLASAPVVKELEGIAPTKITSESLRHLLSLPALQVRRWYELMLIDGALSKLYPQSLPAEFLLCGKNFTPSSLLAHAALPKILFPMVEEEFKLLEIAYCRRQGQDVSGQLERHAEKFGWLASLSWWDEPNSARHYEKIVEELSKNRPEEKLATKIHQRQEQYAAAEKILQELSRKFPRAFEIVDAVRELTGLREENWDAVSKAGARLRPLLRKAAAEFHLSLGQFMQLAPKEAYYLLENNALPQGKSIDELNARLKHYAIVHAKGGDFLIFSGSEAQKLHELVRPPQKEMSELHGMPVFQGRVTGRACVMQTSDDMAKMQQEMVLVCPMSDPDFMAAIRKASAIVADQGGLLCHAAIVARELQIPCVVGTEHATRAIKDGEEIIVDAYKGIVTITKNKSQDAREDY